MMVILRVCTPPFINHFLHILLQNEGNFASARFLDRVNKHTSSSSNAVLTCPSRLVGARFRSHAGVAALARMLVDTTCMDSYRSL